ncbi:MAG: proline iminopeptidase-family hydrolase [Planctomycetota bacterium]
MTKQKQIQEGFVQTNDARLYYKIIGEGEPVVILHGGPGGDHNLMLPMQELASDYKVVFYDQRATGDSSSPLDDNSITVNNFVEDLEELRKELNLGKIHLIGHSWGGGLGMFYAIKYSDNLRSLIICGGGGASNEFFGTYFENLQKNTLPEDQAAIKELEKSEAFKNKETKAYQEYMRLFFKPYFQDKSLVDEVNFTFGKNTVKNQMIVAGLIMKDLGDFNIHDELSSITCPTLIIQGKQDLFPCNGAYKTHKHIRQSKLVILENAGHMLFIDSKDEFFSVVRAFLKDENSVETFIPPDIEEELKTND